LEFIDPWTETLEELLDDYTPNFINSFKIHEELGLETPHLKNTDANRIRKIMSQLGWRYGRLRLTGNGKQKRGFIRM